MMKNENETKKESGLPDVAEGGQRKGVMVVILALVLTVMGVSYLWSNTQAKKTTASSAEEVYTIQSTPTIEKKNEKVIQSQTTQTEKVVTPPINPEVIQQQVALLQAKQKELQQRLAAPLMIVNVGQANSTDVSQKSQTISSDANTAFMQHVSTQNTESATASHIGSLNTVVAEGSLIHAILESATNSDLPGMLRASVSEPVYAEDGTQILIPIGSRLIGQYKSGLSQGQSRIFIVWTRLITPDGFSIQLGSPGVDSLGMAGMGADEIDSHFWQRFGSASLLSLIGAGTSNLGVNGQDQNNSSASYREAVATSFAQSASQSLQQDNRIAPTIKTYQGKPIMVFVAKDLHFENALKSVKPKLNVF